MATPLRTKRLGRTLSAITITITIATLTALAAAARARPGGDSRPHTPAPGFLLTDGRYTGFDVPAAQQGTSPFDIDNRGRITGKYNSGTASSGAGADEHGFVRNRAGRFTTVDVPGARSTSPFGINDRGELVGA
ncbi:hypothetical protein AB5J49_18570 [Streptomyces sp. R28]|uniref:Uncharacterized protein n=1 Tax=Streptomyces sp. R28 TaxID=3238628 RepID=A0AB39PY56_9ACTN